MNREGPKKPAEKYTIIVDGIPIRVEPLGEGRLRTYLGEFSGIGELERYIRGEEEQPARLCRACEQRPAMPKELDDHQICEYCDEFTHVEKDGKIVASYDDYGHRMNLKPES